MDFHEPDLSDLIQSDLHTEMNKILDQSETVDCNIAELSDRVLPMHNAVTDSNSTSQGIHYAKDTSQDKAKSSSVSSKNASISQGSLILPTKVEISEQCEDLGLFYETYTSKDKDFSSKSEPTFSGHFSLEKISAVDTDVIIKTDECQVPTTDINDLSSLAWLTGVDVQQALQQNDGHEHDNLSPLVQEHHAEGSCLPDVARPAALNCTSSKPQVDVSSQASKKQVMRYTPIQPNMTYQDSARYHLHHGDPMQRRLMPSGDQMDGHRYGMHRGYHPYPPPPYGSSGTSYMPDNYRHRMHNQGKKVFPKPVYSYSCLIAMSLRASKTGCLPVSDIYNFMMENFPYFKTAPDGWKNSVRHNLSLNKCFEKVEKPNGSQRKGCLWALNPAKITKMEEEVQKWKRKDPDAIRRSMSNPEELDRELEEMRRADEEATRRRMLSMTTTGLSMLTPPGFHPFARPPHHHNHPNLHPSGTASLPTTPQHFHQQRNPHRSMMQSHGMSAGHSSIEEHSRSDHHPRQLFNYHSDQHNFTYGHPTGSGTPNSGLESGPIQSQASASHLGALSSPYSTSSSSSGNASLLGTLAESFPKTSELHDIDLESSLPDLSAFQGALWDDPDAGLMTHPLVSEVDAFEDVAHQQTSSLPPRITSSSSTSAMEQVVSSEEPVADSGVYGASSRFGGDMSYLNGNSKAVVLH